MILLLALVTQQSPWYLMPAVLWVGAIALQLTLAVCLYLREQFFTKRRRVKAAKNSPCQNCRYFDSNPFLNCALHPTDALTNRSEDCLDYTPYTIVHAEIYRRIDM